MQLIKWKIKSSILSVSQAPSLLSLFSQNQNIFSISMKPGTKISMDAPKLQRLVFSLYLPWVSKSCKAPAAQLLYFLIREERPRKDSQFSFAQSEQPLSPAASLPVTGLSRQTEGRADGVTCSPPSISYDWQLHSHASQPSFPVCLSFMRYQHTTARDLILIEAQTIWQQFMI